MSTQPAEQLALPHKQLLDKLPPMLPGKHALTPGVRELSLQRLIGASWEVAPRNWAETKSVP